jgi:hypothetical protein
MSKSMVGVIPINVREQLVDAKAMGSRLGFTGEYINRMAAAGKIPWHGLRNGAKVYRRFNPAEVMAALAHDGTKKGNRNKQASCDEEHGRYLGTCACGHGNR